MITFEPKPVSIFPSYRPMFRISLILMVLKINCIGSKASLLKLHLFSWGLNQEKNLQQLKDYAINRSEMKIQYFGIEPSLNRALNYAIADNLIGIESGKYYLKEKGNNFIQRIMKDKELFFNERNTLELIGKNINESIVTQLKKNWEKNA